MILGDLILVLSAMEAPGRDRASVQLPSIAPSVIVTNPLNTEEAVKHDDAPAILTIGEFVCSCTV